MKKKDLNTEFKELLKTVLLSLKEELEGIEEFPHDFNSYNLHDKIAEEVDCWASAIDRTEAIAWIDYCKNEDVIDEGVIDRSSLDRTLITMAYECVRQHLFDECELIGEMQEYELSKKQRAKFIKDIEELVGAFRPTRKDSDSQIWVTTDFELDFKDFKEPYFAEAQMVDLHGGIKILASNSKDINRNALVIENHSDKREFRIYLMSKDDNIDIRDFFKYTPTIKENNYSLLASDYIEGKLKKSFEKKKEFIWYINQMVNKLVSTEP